jgi:hypothetical protein
LEFLQKSDFGGKSGPTHALHLFAGKVHEASFDRSGMKISRVNPTIFIARWTQRQTL